MKQAKRTYYKCSQISRPLGDISDPVDQLIVSFYLENVLKSALKPRARKHVSSSPFAQIQRKPEPLQAKISPE
ncbi:hypothetical protein Bhyg_12823 [Pseudolycoriella hygida]|uniref:Uncharacterized protein n=1 Tax=Pseudolycoriella hygida TaxID=35572 RepID=A0A9Q0MZK5_9DIPT|nr:hypothetical protein Bhyg_12823 [Pseudolycoriella hygida]